jgi:hypothetical protein
MDYKNMGTAIFLLLCSHQLFFKLIFKFIIMKNKIIIILVFLFFIWQSCYSQFPDPYGDDGPLTEAKKTICDGCNYCWPTSFPKKPKDGTGRRLKFKAHLYHNCWYDATAEGIKGWNKLGKISFPDDGPGPGFLWEDMYKLHCGWRMIKIEDEHFLGIGLFAHQNYEHIAHWLDTIPFSSDAVIWVNLYLGPEVIAMTVGDKSIGLKQIPDYLPPWWDQHSSLKKTFFFGGTKPAPHKMEMRFSDIHYDKPGFGDWFNSRNYMIWNLSEFLEDDIFAFHAYRQIEGSVKDEGTVTSIPEGMERQSCIINDGADITFVAGERILLHKGFHVKPGGKFHAIIGTKDLYDKLVKDKSINNSFAEPETLEPDFKGSEITDMGNDGFNLNPVFQIYPNPNPGLFTLHFNDGENAGFEVEITNMVGNVVYKNKNMQAGNMAIDIRERPKGIYFVKVVAGGKVYTEKVVVE